MTLDSSIFKAYDIRGIVGESLTIDVVESIGKAIGSMILESGGNTLCVGRDGRLSGPVLMEALVKGVLSTGANVFDVGQVTSPILYFSTHQLKTGNGIIITGSHNPPEYNGLKIVLDFAALYGEQIQSIRERIEKKDFYQGTGELSYHDVTSDYIERISSDIKLSKPINISVDCGNGVAGAFAAKVYRSIGCSVDELFCEVDGNFPNHHPDPSQPKNLQDLISHIASSESQIGLAFDGDGDRLGVIAKNGNIIYPDRLMMLFASDVLSRCPAGEVIFDVKCSRNLSKWIANAGGTPKMWRTGHSLIKAEMRKSGSPLGGEMSGHFFFKERWFGFDDGIYAGARLLEYLSKQESIDDTFTSLPNSLSTPEIQIKCSEGENFSIIEELKKTAKFPTAQEKITIDGLRLEYADGFGLARASNTTPTIVLRFESDSQDGLARIHNEFKEAFRQINENLGFPEIIPA